MNKVTISLYTKTGQLKRYEARTCEDNVAIQDFVKEVCEDFYNSKKWEVNIVKGENGWVRVGMSKSGQRILVNVISQPV